MAFKLDDDVVFASHPEREKKCFYSAANQVPRITRNTHDAVARNQKLICVGVLAVSYARTLGTVR